MFAVIGFLWPIWFKLVKYCYGSWRKNVTTPPLNVLRKTLSGQLSNEIGTELQVIRGDQLLKRNEAALKIETEEGQQEPPSLTAFVQHGVLTDGRM